MLALGLTAVFSRSILIILFQEDALLPLELPAGRQPAALAAPHAVVLAVEDALVVVVVFKHAVDKMLL